MIKALSGRDPMEGRTFTQLPSGDLIFVGAVEISSVVTAILVIQIDQAGEILWAETLTATGMETPRGVIVTSDGGIVIIGMTTSGTLGAEDISVIKLNSSGNILWSKVYGGAMEDRGFGIMETPDHFLLLAGSTRSYGVAERDAILIKTDLDGNVIWTKTYGGNSNDVFLNFHPISETELAIAGVTYSFGSGMHDVWLVRVDGDGSLISADTYGTTADENTMICRQTADNGFAIVAHNTFASFGDYDGTIIKITSTGSVAWVKVFGGAGTDFLRGLAIDEDQNMFLSGSTNSSGAGMTDMFLVKVDANGNLVNARTYGQMGEDNVFWVGQGSLQELPNDRILMTGILENSGKNEILFANFADDIEDVCLGADWPLQYESATVSRGTQVPTIGSPTIASADLDFLSENYALQSNYLTSEYCPTDLTITINSTLCSYQASNILTTSGQVEIMGEITFKAGNSISLQPGFRTLAGAEFRAIIETCNGANALAGSSRPATDLSLEQPRYDEPGQPQLLVYPNPVNTSLRIEFQLPQSGQVSLSLLNASGKQLRSILADGLLKNGHQSWDLDVSDLADGLYFIRLRTENHLETVRFLKVR